MKTFALLFVLLLVGNAYAETRCTTTCHNDAWGRRVCHTVCR
jgi:hypothetical protein